MSESELKVEIDKFLNRRIHQGFCIGAIFILLLLLDLRQYSIFGLMIFYFGIYHLNSPIYSKMEKDGRFRSLYDTLVSLGNWISDFSIGLVYVICLIFKLIELNGLTFVLGALTMFSFMQTQKLYEKLQMDLEKQQKKEDR